MQLKQTVFGDGIHKLVYTNTSGSPITAGSVVEIAVGNGKEAWIALDTIADDASGIIVRHNFAAVLTKANSVYVTQGQKLYWASTAATTSGNSVGTFLGQARETAVTATTTIDVIVGGERPQNED
jgi:predicted RecA/RadA family phage recombinase